VAPEVWRSRSVVTSLTAAAALYAGLVEATQPPETPGLAIR
jgi:anti-sigma-K factor RskA